MFQIQTVKVILRSCLAELMKRLCNHVTLGWKGGGVRGWWGGVGWDGMGGNGAGGSLCAWWPILSLDHITHFTFSSTLLLTFTHTCTFIKYRLYHSHLLIFIYNNSGQNVHEEIKILGRNKNNCQVLMTTNSIQIKYEHERNRKVKFSVWAHPF